MFWVILGSCRNLTDQKFIKNVFHSGQSAMDAALYGTFLNPVVLKPWKITQKGQIDFLKHKLEIFDPKNQIKTKISKKNLFF